MYALYELFAIAAGVLIGGLIYRTTTRSKIVTVLLSSVVVGAFVSFISGELFVSWAFLAIDTGIVLLSACLTLVFAAGWRGQRGYANRGR